MFCLSGVDEFNPEFLTVGWNHFIDSRELLQGHGISPIDLSNLGQGTFSNFNQPIYQPSIPSYQPLKEERKPRFEQQWNLNVNDNSANTKYRSASSNNIHPALPTFGAINNQKLGITQNNTHQVTNPLWNIDNPMIDLNKGFDAPYFGTSPNTTNFQTDFKNNNNTNLNIPPKFSDPLNTNNTQQRGRAEDKNLQGIKRDLSANIPRNNYNTTNTKNIPSYNYGNTPKVVPPYIPLDIPTFQPQPYQNQASYPLNTPPVGVNYNPPPTQYQNYKGYDSNTNQYQISPEITKIINEAKNKQNPPSSYAPAYPNIASNTNNNTANNIPNTTKVDYKIPSYQQNYAPQTNQIPSYTPSTQAPQSFVPLNNIPTQKFPAYTNDYKPSGNNNKQQPNLMGSSLLRSTRSPFFSQEVKVISAKLDSKFQKALQQCQMNSRDFTDYEFPACERSIAPPNEMKEYRGIQKWARPKEIYGNNDFELYYQVIEPNDVQQGNLGDCAFLSSIAAIAEKPERIQKLFINKEKSKYGLYGLNIIWKGVMTEVLVDDLIPVGKNNKPYFQQSQEKELWAFLAEKAWAKLHSSYSQLNGQLSKESLHDLTGAAIRNFDPQRTDEEMLWTKLIEAKGINSSHNWIVTAGTEGEDVGNSTDPLKKVGLVSGHAYSIIGAYEITVKKGYRDIKERLIKLRNPWGEFESEINFFDMKEWNKTFSDKDENWQDVTQSTQLRIDKNELDDGIFFMQLSRFREYFDTMDICYSFDDFQYFSIKCRTAFNQSKYFKIEIKKEASCFFFVSQLSIRVFNEHYQFENPKDQGHYSETKYCIIDSNGNVLQKVQGKKRDLFSPKYIDQEGMKKFKAGTYYGFVNVNWQKYATHSFGFGIYTKDATIQEILPYEAKQLQDSCEKWLANSYSCSDAESVYGRV